MAYYIWQYYLGISIVLWVFPKGVVCLPLLGDFDKKTSLIICTFSLEAHIFPQPFQQL